VLPQLGSEGGGCLASPRPGISHGGGTHGGRSSLCYAPLLLGFAGSAVLARLMALN
jgi:hypothetical protein